MPLFDDTNMETHTIGGSRYGYSATRIDALGSAEYTLVMLAVDVSGSVAGFRAQIENVLKEVVKACRHSPRADNLMLRLVLFDHALSETHGFRPLIECDVTKYDGVVQIGGSTALFDASQNAVESVVRYGKDLRAQEYTANAIVVVITDGDDNASAMTTTTVKAAIDDAVKSEALESIRTILIGVNTSQGNVSSYLQNFKAKVGFDQYVDIGVADEKSLAKLAAFVSRSISSQSQSLGSGGPSQAITF